MSYPIDYSATNSFTPVALALHSNDNRLSPFIDAPFDLDNLLEKANRRSTLGVDREILHGELLNQYQGDSITKEVKENLERLRLANTFTITTGHQLCLFTGPIYFIYKIAHAINLAKALKERQSDKFFVPVFWMATEDHDFAEIQSTNINGSKLTWETAANGWPVGRLGVSGVDQVISQLEKSLGEGPRCSEIATLLRKFYQEGSTLTRATRQLVNHLFGKYGLIIIDGDSQRFKTLFAPYMANELKSEENFKAIERQTNQLEHQFKSQVNPRSCNLFLFQDGVRRRIDRTETGFQLAETEIVFTTQELLARLASSPEDFSPNVVMRPLYQEVLLPNLAYIGGGGELNYWLQLKPMFALNEVSFPLLILRNSAIIIDQTVYDKIQELDISMEELFKPEVELIKDKVRVEESDGFEETEKQLAAVLLAHDNLVYLVGKSNPSLTIHLEAHRQKELVFQQKLEKKILRAAKKRQEVLVKKISNIKSELFPGGGLQERKDNFFTYFYRYGPQVLETLVEGLDPENKTFTIFVLSAK